MTSLLPPLRAGLATLSPCGTHRYTLTRHRGPAFQGPRVVFVMLNPSTADATIDDPTIRRCSGFADRLGFDRLDVVNLFSWRATSPLDLLCAWQPDGDPENMRAILETCTGAALVVAAWGGPYSPKPLRKMIEARARLVADLAYEHGFALHALAVTKDGHPRHPLYLPGDAQPMPWRPTT